MMNDRWTDGAKPKAEGHAAGRAHAAILIRDAALEGAVGGMCVNHKLFLDSVAGKPEPADIAKREAQARSTAWLQGLGISLPVVL